MENFSGGRVLQDQQISMEGLPAKSRQRRLALRAELARLGFETGAINVVAEQRMAEMGEVDADLMGAAGLELAGQQRGDWFAVPAGEALEGLDRKSVV